ncbi:MAG: hypothetical protein ACFFAN_13610 [Promethearchaeota archaeon]
MNLPKWRKKDIYEIFKKLRQRKLEEVEYVKDLIVIKKSED